MTDEIVAAPHDPSRCMAAAASKQQMLRAGVLITGDAPIEASGRSVRRKGREKAVALDAESLSPAVNRAKSRVWYGDLRQGNQARSFS